ncbi:MAG: type II secretion system major pseudopilin GspG [Planctomycetota bacterium]
MSNKKTLIGLTIAVIIVILAFMVFPMVIPHLCTFVVAKKAVAKADITIISQALEMYKTDNRCFPTTEQGIKALVEKPLPPPSNWGGPYLKKEPVDSWQKPYKYRCPSQNGQPDFDLWSLGPDGKDGTEDDITNWKK